MPERSIKEFLADLEMQAAEEDENERSFLAPPILENRSGNPTMSGAAPTAIQPPASRSQPTVISAVTQTPPQATTSRPKFCRHCGTKLKPEGHFCTKCGQPIQP